MVSVGFWGGGIYLSGTGEEGAVPLLDLVETGKEGDGDEDDDCFFAVADFELWGGERDLVSLCTANSNNRRADLWLDGHRPSRRAHTE